MKDVEITREPIELYKLLKFEGIAMSGGEANQKGNKPLPKNKWS